MITDEDIRDKKRADEIKASLIPYDPNDSKHSLGGKELFDRLMGSEVVNIVGIGENVSVIDSEDE